MDRLDFALHAPEAPAAARSSLSPEKAFVVQFRVGGRAANEPFAGHVEYVPSISSSRASACRSLRRRLAGAAGDEIEVLPGADYAPSLAPRITITLLGTEKKPKQ